MASDRYTKPELTKVINKTTEKVLESLYLSCLMYLSSDGISSNNYPSKVIENLQTNLTNLVYECDRYYPADNTIPDLVNYANISIPDYKKVKDPKKLLSILQDNYNEVKKILTKYARDTAYEELKNSKDEWLMGFDHDEFSKEVANLIEGMRTFPKKAMNGLKLGNKIDFGKHSNEIYNKVMLEALKEAPSSLAGILDKYKEILETGAEDLKEIGWLKKGLINLPEYSKEGSDVIVIKKEDIDSYYNPKKNPFKKVVGVGIANVKNKDFKFVGCNSEYFIDKYTKELARSEGLDHKKLYKVFITTFEKNYKIIK